MELGELISLYRQQAGLTIDDLVEKSGVPKGTITKIIGGVTKAPTLENVKAIARALGKRLADFDDDTNTEDSFSLAERDIIKKYRLLDPEGQAHINTALNWETDRTKAIKKLRDKQTTVIDFDGQQNVPTRYIQYYQKVSAGTGELIYEDTQPEQIAIPDIPKFRRVAYAVKVSGHSMENTYYDGDLLLIEPACIVDVGEIGIFNVDEKAFVKKRGETELISLNKGYGNVPLTNEARCMGRVVDRYVAD